MSSAAKEAASRIYAQALEQKIRFPLTWNEGQIRQQIGASLMMNKLEDGTFNDSAVLDSLIEKYGKVEDLSKKRAAAEADEEDEEENEDEDEDENEEESGTQKKKRAKKEKKPKVKKTDIVTCEENRALAAAIKEIGDIYFKNKEIRKGTVYSKAAKSLREADIPIKTKKEAMALPGVGAGIAAYIVEFNTSGAIMKLEEMRAGTA